MKSIFVKTAQTSSNHAMSDQDPATAATNPSRRRFIELVGGGAVVCAVPLASGCSTSMPAAAVAPWHLPQASGDLRRYMLAHALLAPNPHNRQPWVADLRQANEITLICDKDRLLPETDPFGRQIVVGCGAFIELAVMAAAQRRHRVQVQLFPDGEPDSAKLPGGSKIARLVLTPGAAIAPDPLLAQVALRRTNKGAYDSARPVATEQWTQFISAGRDFGLLSGSVTQTSQVQSVRDITRASYELETITPRTWLESGRLIRMGPSAIEKNRDGISIMGTMPRLLTAVGLFNPLDVPVKGDSNYKRMMERWAAFETGSGYFWLASKGNTRSAQVSSGRAYVRAQLMATAAGLSMHPVSQALQEFAEVAQPYQALHRLLGFDPAANTVQMLARVGYPLVPSEPTPRRDLATMLQV